MIENNDNKPKNESELDIAELLRRYMPDEYTADANADAGTNADADVDADVKEYGRSPEAENTAEKVKRPRRRLTARRQINEEHEDIVKPDLAAAEADDVMAEIDELLATGADESEAVDDFIVPENTEDGVDVASDTAKDDVTIEARSFDPDVDIFSEFEEPRDELYDYIDEAFAEAADVDVVDTNDDNAATVEINIVGSGDDAEANGETMVFDALAPTDETALDETDDFEIEQNGDGVDASEEMNDFDLNIMLALGMEDELEESVGADRVTEYVERQQGHIEKVTTLNRERAALDYEYTTKTQVREVIEAYQTAYRNAKIKFVYGAVLALILMLFECHAAFGIKLTGAFDLTLYPVVYIMVCFQLLVLIAAPAGKSLYIGLLDFFRGKPAPESVAAVAVILDVIYTVIACFVTDFGETGLITFNFPVAVGLLLLYGYEVINIRREILSFSIVSSKKPKYALESLSMSESKLEFEAFSDMMEEDDDADDIGVLKIECADFVNDYFLRSNHYPNGRKFIGFIVPAAIVIAAAFFAYKYSNAGICGGMQAALSTALVCLPASVFYMFSHPFYMANEKAHEEESTIIGEGSAEEYADSAIISFDDKNVFPSTGVNVRAVNVFGNNRIDRVLYYAASTFCTVGGPLSDVFDLATRDIGYSTDVKLLRALPGLLETEVDGSIIAFGSIDALEEAGVKIPNPLEAHREDTFEPTVSVMYMVKDGKFIARMLISYIIDSDFEFILKQLDRGGMFIGMKTFDPNITEQFIGAQVKLADYPIRVIRCKSLDDRTKISDKTSSGLISKDSPKSVLQTVSLCEKVLHARSINTMIVVISLFVGLLVAALSILFGALTLSPLFIALYTVFWVIPMYIVSKVII